MFAASLRQRMARVPLGIDCPESHRNEKCTREGHRGGKTCAAQIRRLSIEPSQRCTRLRKAYPSRSLRSERVDTWESVHGEVGCFNGQLYDSGDRSPIFIQSNFRYSSDRRL
jgi:hypothetical protein